MKFQCIFGIAKIHTHKTTDNVFSKLLRMSQIKKSFSISSEEFRISEQWKCNIKNQETNPWSDRNGSYLKFHCLMDFASELSTSLSNWWGFYS